MGADEVEEARPRLHGPVDPTRAACGVCAAVGIGFVADLRYFPGDAFALPRPLLLCARCRTLIATGNRFVLGTVISPALAARGRDRVATYLLHRVDRVIPAAAPPPELEDLRAQGFEVLADLTDAIEESAAVWPPAHRTCLAGPQPDKSTPTSATTDGVWLVRSPWPALALVEVFEMLWRWVERGAPDPAARLQRMAEVFTWSSAQASAWLDLSRDR